MLTATEDETNRVREYMSSQLPDLVQLVQKVYSENILSARHDVWNVHTDVDRWWVITDPTLRRSRPTASVDDREIAYFLAAPWRDHGTSVPETHRKSEAHPKQFVHTLCTPATS
jgi:hypothetical protein